MVCKRIETKQGTNIRNVVFEGQPTVSIDDACKTQVRQIKLITTPRQRTKETAKHPTPTGLHKTYPADEGDLLLYRGKVSIEGISPIWKQSIPI